MKTRRLAVGVLAAALTMAFSGVAKADLVLGTADQWQCLGMAPYSTCSDPGGIMRNKAVNASFQNDNNELNGYTGMCIKAATAAGNTKDGSRCFTASDGYVTPNQRDNTVTFTSSLPTSQAYYYYGSDVRSNRSSTNGAVSMAYFYTLIPG